LPDWKIFKKDTVRNENKGNYAEDIICIKLLNKCSYKHKNLKKEGNFNQHTNFIFVVRVCVKRVLDIT
jgi:hypothetical protein